jgi:hypothetical protein
MKVGRVRNSSSFLLSYLRFLFILSSFYDINLLLLPPSAIALATLTDYDNCLLSRTPARPPATRLPADSTTYACSDAA